MVKIQKISSIEPTLGFTEFDILQKYRQSYERSELGHLYAMIPFSELTHSMHLRDAPLGRKSFFSPEGQLALMFLKTYANFSDFELLEHLNGNIYYQLLCGISFIKRLSFQAFNEGIRLKDCIRLQQRLTKTRVRAVAADSIYANNENRKFCTQYGIATSFVRKGRVAKDEKLRKILRSELSRERATRLEGSIGTQKQHYSLAKVKARNRATETLWIFFGIHTANAICIIEKRYKERAA